MKMQCFIIWLILIFSADSIFAQEENMRFINYGAKDGLADKYIYSAAQDKKGYMWFGTASGLYRYDGHSFKIFRSTADKAGRTISNILQSVYCDATGNLWLGSLNTLQWYDPRKNIFWSPDLLKPEIRSLADGYVSTITGDSMGNTWIATNKDYFYGFRKADSSFHSYRNVFPSSASKTTIKVLESGKMLWAIHQEGIYQFNSENEKALFYPFPLGDITNAFADKNSIWLTTFSGVILQFDTETKKISNATAGFPALSKNDLFCGTRDKLGNTWIGSYTLFKLNDKPSSLVTVPNKKESDFDLKVSPISNLFFDKESNLWICSFSGLSMMPWQNQQVQALPMYDPLSTHTVEPTGIYDINDSRDFLVANTSSAGLMHYRADRNELICIRNPFGIAINGIVKAPDGKIFASDGTHFFRYIPETQILQPFELKDQEGKPIINVGRNCFDQQGNIYISSINNGFYAWSYPGGRLKHFNCQDVDTDSSAKMDNNIYPCIADHKGNIWFSSAAGVYEYDPLKNLFLHHLIKEYPGIPLVTETRFIAEDKLGHFWIATINNGLYELYFEKGKEVVKNYNKSSGNGIPSDYCLKIKADNRDSSLWISFNTGLARFDPVSKKVTSLINQQRGLYRDDSYTFNITANNDLVTVYFGWLNKINTDSFQYNLVPPKVALNSVKVMDREYVYTLDNDEPVLRLASDENFLQFEFTALIFNNSNQDQYAWQMEGADKDWVYGGNNNMVSYSGLPGGTYIFNVKAANNDGIWGAVKRIKIIIRPPFYASTWFICLCILLVAGLIFWWNRSRINQVKKEEKLKATYSQQLAETEMKALRAQMNPHFIFNSLNSIQKYILQNDHFAASQYLTKFSRLIRLILDHSNQNSILLGSELELLKLYLEMESLRFEDQFEYEIRQEGLVNADTVEIPSMLVQPYVENAIWHGLLHMDEKGKLLIVFSSLPGNELRVTIEDNGIGREKAAELKSKQVLKKKSYGMQITEDRIAIINQTQNIHATCQIIDLKDETGRATGTRVELDIPYKSLTTN